jgi:ligand-binding sensor domain-containing protein/uncharacterized membrane-anchored protein YhcB (DUF1043 family)
MLTLIRKISLPHILIVTFIFGSSLLFSQNHYTRNITTDNGLPSNSIQDIFKDSRGIIWIGTEGGLCRYDGTEMVIYTIADGLPGNRIWSITEDDKGDLWFGCYGKGISRFDGKKFFNYSESDGLVNDNVRKVKFSMKSKGLMIGTIYGFSYLKDSVFTSFQDSLVTERDLLQVTDFIDCDSLIYLLTYWDTFRFIEFNPYTGKFNYLPADHRFHSGSVFSTSAFITSWKDTLMANHIDGVKVFTGDSIEFIHSMGQVFDITEDKNGDLWIASWNEKEIPDIKGRGGIYRVRDKRAVWYNDSLGINTEKCWTVYYDENENLLWIGTLDMGIYLYPLSGISYLNARELNPHRPAIGDIICHSRAGIQLSVGDRIISPAGNKSILLSDSFNESYRKFIIRNYSFLNDKKDSNGKNKSGEYLSLLEGRVNEFQNLFEDCTGKLWVKTNLGVFEIENQTVTRFGSIRYGGGLSFFISKDSTVSFLQQFELVNFRNGIFNTFRLRKNTTYSSYCNFFQEGEVFWIYNNTDGVIKYENGKLKYFNYLSNIIDLTFSSLTGDRHGNLIAGTSSGLIYVLDTKNDSLNLKYQISKVDGIIGSDIKWLVTDIEDRLWFMTNSGLNMINLDSLYKKGEKAVCFFNEENGFFDNKSRKAILGPGGKIYSISDNHLTIIDPAELMQSVKKSNQLFIKHIEINFNETALSSIAQQANWSNIPEKELVLAYDKNTLTFYFHLLSYSEPSKTQYSYILNKGQKHWTDFSKDNKAVFTGLRPGKYFLKIRGRLLSFPENITETGYAFRILPPWYLKWWFLSMVIILILFAGYLFIRYRFREIKKEAEITRKLEVLKLEALKAQMNPHFIFNAFNSIQKYILNQDSNSALNYMSDFAMLIRKTLDNSTREKVCLTDEISYLKSYIELEKRRILNLNYQIEIDEDIDSDGIFIPPMLIQPVVENSILHGIRHLEGEGMVTIIFRLSGQSGNLICIVKDNGIGRERSRELYRLQGKTHSSMGSEIIQQRARLYGVELKFTEPEPEFNSHSCGTTVEFRF